METVRTRINFLIEDLNLSKNEFAREVGISSAMISKITIKEVNFGIDVYKKIIDKYPHLNQQWLLFGEGEMWLENHTLKPHLNTHLSNNSVENRERSSSAQKIFDDMMAESKEKYREYEEFAANKDNVQYIYVRKIYDFLRDNNPELYNLRNNIDIMLGLKDVIFQFEESLFPSVDRAFWYFPKGDFNMQKYENQVIKALKDFEDYDKPFNKLVEAVIIFYSEMKALNKVNVDFDTYSLNRI